MEITYKKINNKNLFKDFEDENLLNMENCQNYIPLYNNFFTLNDNNYNSINLNNKNHLNSLKKKYTENIFLGTIKDDNDNIIEKNIFFKLCPLLDPYKYMAGKYDISDSNLLNLPKLNDNLCHNKIINLNNSSYVDGFFTYLTSQLYNRSNFYHGLDYYGSYIGYKKNLHIDIGEDIDMLEDSDFFYKNMNKLYSFINSDHEILFNDGSRSNKKPLNFGEDIDDSLLKLDDITCIDSNELSYTLNNNELLEKNIIDISNIEVDISELQENKKYEISRVNNISRTNSINSEFSSRSSNTNNSESSNNSDNSSEEYTDESSCLENIIISIDKFPIQIITLENCNNTLDYLFNENKLSQEELGCIVVQILMMLITYQKLFNLTHNDLHTNNIMYIQTEKKYLYYKFNNQHYKVKTFGKIFKIIDFGRAIYNYKNTLICSDSFYSDGDASTQYNFGPFYNKNKPLIEPNFSFDLCRLGCSIYDFITEKYETLEEIRSPIYKIIMSWCDDDDNRNILYKNNGEERYPDFKLYKMIARKVHNHIPKDEIKNSFFNKYIVAKKEIKKGSNIWNIDIL